MAAENDSQQWTSVTLEYAVKLEVDVSFTIRTHFYEDISRKKDLLVQPWLSAKTAGTEEPVNSDSSRQSKRNCSIGLKRILDDRCLMDGLGRSGLENSNEIKPTSRRGRLDG